MLAATLRYRVIQRQQIAELSNTKKVRFNDIFDTGNKKKLQWRIENLQLTKGKTLINSQHQITISFNASLDSWGAYCQGQKRGGP